MWLVRKRSHILYEKKINKYCKCSLIGHPPKNYLSFGCAGVVLRCRHRRHCHDMSSRQLILLLTRLFVLIIITINIHAMPHINLFIVAVAIVRHIFFSLLRIITYYSDPGHFLSTRSVVPCVLSVLFRFSLCSILTKQVRGRRQSLRANNKKVICTQFVIFFFSLFFSSSPRIHIYYNTNLHFICAKCVSAHSNIDDYYLKQLNVSAHVSVSVSVGRCIR